MSRDQNDEKSQQRFNPTDGFFVWVKYKPKIERGWFMAFQNAFIELSKDEELSKLGYRVLLYLMGTLDFENFIHITQKTIAEELSIDKGNVSRAVNLLLNRGIIAKRGVGQMAGYKLNEFYGWKGKVKNMPKPPYLRVVK